MLTLVGRLLSSGQPQPGVTTAGPGPASDGLTLFIVLVFMGVVIWLMVQDQGTKKK